MFAIARRILWKSFLLMLGIAAWVLVVVIAVLGVAGLSVGRQNIAAGAVLGLLVLTTLTTAALCVPTLRR